MESWRPIPDLAPYEASSEGRIRNGVSGKVRKLQLDRYGYLRVELGGKVRKVHRLVYLAFHGSIPEGEVIHHRNARRADNRVWNLEAMSQTENSRIGIDQGDALRLILQRLDRLEGIITGSIWKPLDGQTEEGKGLEPS